MSQQKSTQKFSNSSLQNRFVRWGFPLFINFFQVLSFFNAGLRPIIFVVSPEEGERCHSAVADKIGATDRSNKKSFGPNTFVLGIHYYFVVI